MSIGLRRTRHMAKSTLIVVGPGGVGKSPIDDIVRSDVVRLDPYRLRSDGPRNQDDRLYAPPKLRDEVDGSYRLAVPRVCVQARR